MKFEILIIACLTLASAEPVTLTGTNFSELVMKTDVPWFIKFYAPWCGACKALAPKWAEFAKKHHELKDLNVGEVDCTEEENKPLCQ